MVKKRAAPTNPGVELLRIVSYVSTGTDSSHGLDVRIIAGLMRLAERYGIKVKGSPVVSIGFVG
jgi:hypothetical protein